MSHNSASVPGSAWARKNVGLIAGLVAIIVIAVVVVGYLSWRKGINNDAFDRQRQVVSAYNNYQTELSNCLDKTGISAQVATTEYAQLKNTMTAIIAARYQTPDGQTTRAGGALGGGQLISALQEQYPQIDNSLWKELQTTAVGCRNQVAGSNKQLQFVAGNFDTWTNQGSIFSSPIRNNWPDERLKAFGLQGPLTGRDALDFIVQPITTGEATQAIRTHEMPSQQLFPSSSPSPSQ